MASDWNIDEFKEAVRRATDSMKAEFDDRLTVLEARQATPEPKPDVNLPSACGLSRRAAKIRELYEHVGVQFQGPGMNYPAAGGAYANVQAKMVELWPWLKED